jgi:hypothetical protein
MKLNILAAYIAMSLSLYACKETTLPNYETKVKVQVIDDTGNPVPRVNVDVTHDYMAQTNNNGKQAVTDNKGYAETSAKSLATIWIRTSSQDYYPTFEDEVANVVSPQDYTASPLRELNHSIKLRKIINPIPLYSKQNDIPIPDKEKWIGFDLEKIDWVKPYGLGISSDVEFYLSTAPIHVNRETLAEQKILLDRITKEHSENQRQKSAYLESRDEFYELRKGTSTYEEAIKFRLYKWQGSVKMRVPYEQGGIIAEKEKYLIYSKSPQTDYARLPVPEMRMPHHAPKDGYQKEYHWQKTSAEQLEIDEKLGFFIKTRVKLDEQGREISAHYAKFITDVQIDIRGRIKFTSYFNPTPNDTNLEFDLKNNLFKNLKDSEKPFLP